MTVSRFVVVFELIVFLMMILLLGKLWLTGVRSVGLLAPVLRKVPYGVLFVAMVPSMQIRPLSVCVV